MTMAMAKGRAWLTLFLLLASTFAAGAFAKSSAKGRKSLGADTSHLSTTDKDDYSKREVLQKEEEATVCETAADMPLGCVPACTGKGPDIAVNGNGELVT
ncbi:hypothetical protein CBR_g47975 [Chara braunii]|uniref:Uncharacterized protein n=1 Tax=Chara braunii TaxID=69332 RepID=A0A388M1R6_CHABU|nr:hypothetical protein CBR_g47975 [Chara braunii]|eukprot:GBG88504.1 hypothetical protein CBR_g47975 [Chara braunii]